MSRAVDEWIGRDADSKIPDRVRLRVWDRYSGRCHRCDREIPTGDRWIVEHLIALVNLGENRESNLRLTCSWCKPLKDAEDVAEKAKTYAVRSSHILPRKQSRLRSRSFDKTPPQLSASRPLRTPDEKKAK